MRMLIGVYLSLGFLIGFGLVVWLLVSSARRHGLRSTVRHATRTYIEELSLHWRVPWAAWTFLIAAPLIAAWAILSGDWDPLGAASLVLLCLFYVALLRLHRRAKTRAREGPPRPRHTRELG
jgi:hypothetical protein